MVVDTPDYDGFDDMSEKEPVAIISPDPADMDTDPLQDLPLATDCTCKALDLGQAMNLCANVIDH
jgi:hypothetical protein